MIEKLRSNSISFSWQGNHDDPTVHLIYWKANRTDSFLCSLAGIISLILIYFWLWILQFFIDKHVWWRTDWLCFIGLGRRVFARTAADTAASMPPSHTRMRRGESNGSLNGVIGWARVHLAQTQRFQKSNDWHSHMNHLLIV